MTQNGLIFLKDIRKEFIRGSEKLEVLQDIQLSIREGEFIALMGPSGSGKSTLLNLIAGIDKPSFGGVWVEDSEISKLNEAQLAPWRCRRIGFIFQFYYLVPVLTAFENVELPLLLLKMSKTERAQRVETALKIVGLSERAGHLPNQLSGGEEQRVAIARAIVADPKIILADEPTGDLDAKSAQEVLRLLELLNQEFGKTIIMVTHDPKAASHARRLLHLEKGSLIEKNNTINS